MKKYLLTLLAACVLPAGALAQPALSPAPSSAPSISLAGVLGAKALLVVNGSPPKSLAPGESFQSVKVISVDRDAATVETGGRQLVLRIGESPTSVGGRGIGNNTRIVLNGDSRGHFFVQGSINGHVMQFLVDTGATSVSISVAEAERMRLDYKAGQQIRVNTANGVSPAWRVRLSSIRMGDVEVYDVEAVVVPTPLPFGLLGNSFLTRFQMTRQNDLMVLEKRP
jgi:aspartyl protease family protein